MIHTSSYIQINLTVINIISIMEYVCTKSTPYGEEDIIPSKRVTPSLRPTFCYVELSFLPRLLVTSCTIVGIWV